MSTCIGLDDTFCYTATKVFKKRRGQKRSQLISQVIRPLLFWRTPYMQIKLLSPAIGRHEIARKEKLRRYIIYNNMNIQASKLWEERKSWDTSSIFNLVALISLVFSTFVYYYKNFFFSYGHSVLKLFQSWAYITL